MAKSGKSVYTTLTSRIGTLSDEEKMLTKHITAYERKISALEQQREEVLGTLATHYLPDLEAASVKTTIRTLQKEVQTLFAQKQLKREQLDDLLQTTLADKTTTEHKLELVDADLSAKIDERESTQKTIVAALEGRQDYRDLHGKTQQMQHQLDQNKRRLTAFNTDAEAKLRVYESDPFFKYLLDREFDTPESKGNRLTRALDAWVAKLVDYRKQHAHYTFLQTMSDALTADVTQKQEHLDLLVERLKAIEDEVTTSHGLRKIVEQGKALEQKKKTLLDTLSQQDKRVQSYEQEKTTLSSKQDPYHQEALGKLKEYLKGNTLQELQARARQSKTEEDDKLVEQLETVDTHMRALRKEAKALQDNQGALTDQLQRLREVDASFRAKDYEASRSTFTDTFDLDTLLVLYLADKLSHRDLMTKMHDAQHFKPAETYSPSSWSGSYTSTGSSRRSSGSDSTFSTGGGFGSIFGGGGHSTGGGFGGGGGMRTGGGF